MGQGGGRIMSSPLLPWCLGAQSQPSSGVVLRSGPFGPVGVWVKSINPSGSFWFHTHSCFCLVPENVPGNHAAPGEWPGHLPVSPGLSPPSRGRVNPFTPEHRLWLSPQEFGDHPNIVRLLDVVQANNDKDIYLVFECMGEQGLVSPEPLHCPGLVPSVCPSAAQVPAVASTLTSDSAPAPKDKQLACMCQPLGDLGSNHLDSTHPLKVPALSAVHSCIFLFLLIL